MSKMATESGQGKSGRGLESRTGLSVAADSRPFSVAAGRREVAPRGKDEQRHLAENS